MLTSLYVCAKTSVLDSLLYALGVAVDSDGVDCSRLLPVVSRVISRRRGCACHQPLRARTHAIINSGNLIVLEI